MFHGMIFQTKLLKSKNIIIDEREMHNKKVFLLIKLQLSNLYLILISSI